MIPVLFPSFLACGRGFYKSSSQDLQCSRCPMHSFSDREGSSRCDCEDSYYRAPTDPPYVACTSELFLSYFLLLSQSQSLISPSPIQFCIGHKAAVEAFSNEFCKIAKGRKLKRNNVESNKCNACVFQHTLKQTRKKHITERRL